jgi:hypothetical protein
VHGHGQEQLRRSVDTCQGEDESQSQIERVEHLAHNLKMAVIIVTG